jgi:hypothetical protein
MLPLSSFKAHFLFFLITFIFVLGCSKDDKNENLLDKFLLGRDETKIQYEIEELVIYEGDTSSMSTYERILTKPEVDRRAVIYTIREDGSTKVESQSLEPTINKRIPSGIDKKSNRKKICRTVIDGADMFLFDSTNSLIRSVKVTPLDLPDLKTSIDRIKERNDSIGIVLTDLFMCSNSPYNSLQLMQYLNNPPTGAIVQNFGNGIFSIRLTLNTAYPEVAATVVILNTNIGRVLGYRIYNLQDEVIDSMLFNYDNCQLTGYQQTVPVTLSTGRKVFTRTFASITNFQCLINQ